MVTNMGETKNILDGYFFENNQEFLKAQKEKEVIEQMKKTMAWNNPSVAYQLYQKILDKNSFTTVIGFQFLQQLRSVILKSGVKREEELLPIKITTMELKDKKQKNSNQGNLTEKNSSSMSNLQNKQLEKHRQIAEKYKTANRTKNIIITFLILMIVGMLAVSQLTPYSIFTNYEEKIINQYEAWEKELEEREAAVTKREEKLKK